MFINLLREEVAASPETTDEEIDEAFNLIMPLLKRDITKMTDEEMEKFWEGVARKEYPGATEEEIDGYVKKYAEKYKNTVNEIKKVPLEKVIASAGNDEV